MSLPSRPSALEIAFVIVAVLGTGAWLAVGVSDALAARAERDADVRRMRADASTQDVASGRRFAARDELIDANLEVVRRFVAGGVDAPEPAVVADAIEALVESRAREDPEVIAALNELLRALTEREDLEGFLDADLMTARDLVLDVLPDTPNEE